MKQSLEDIEVIIVDDCSTDGTEEFVKSINDERLLYMKNERNAGSEISRMNALRHARGKYITFLDDDDYYTDYEFFSQAIAVHENAEKPLAFVCADGQILETETGRTIPHAPKIG